MVKFAEVLDKYMAVKYQLAVWDEILNFLGQFSSQYDGTPPQKEITTEMGEVPVEHVDEVKELVNQKTVELNQALALLGDTEINNDWKKGKKGAKGSRKEGGEESGEGAGSVDTGRKPSRLTLPKARGRGKGAGKS